MKKIDWSIRPELQGMVEDGIITETQAREVIMKAKKTEDEKRRDELQALFSKVHTATRRLLTVAKCGIKNFDSAHKTHLLNIYYCALIGGADHLCVFSEVARKVCFNLEGGVILTLCHFFFGNVKRN